MNRRILAAALAAAAAVPLAGCFERTLSEVGPLGVIMKILGGGFPSARGKAAQKLDQVLPVRIDAEVGGLSGTYTVTLSSDGGPSFGTMTGTGKIKKGRFVTIKDNGSEDLKGIVANICSQVLEANVTIEKAKAKVTANQEPGGVAANWKGTVKFKGMVDTGPSAGAKIRNGKLSIEGHRDFQ